MRSSDSAGRHFSRLSGRTEFTSEEPIDVLPRLGRLHELVYRSLLSAAESDLWVTVPRLLVRCNSAGYPTSQLTMQGVVNDLARLGLVRVAQSGRVELDSPLMVLGSVS
jgi:hypothetical protein